MPGGDGSGPLGQGPLTGRAMGRCAGYASGGYQSAPGRGSMRRFPSFGRGGGRGWRNRFYDTGEPYWRRGVIPPAEGWEGQSEIDLLSSRVEAVARVIEDIASRVKHMLDQRKTRRNS